MIGERRWAYSDVCQEEKNRRSRPFLFERRGKISVKKWLDRNFEISIDLVERILLSITLGLYRDLRDPI